MSSVSGPAANDPVMFPKPERAVPTQASAFAGGEEKSRFRVDVFTLTSPQPRSIEILASNRMKAERIAKARGYVVLSTSAASRRKSKK